MAYRIILIESTRINLAIDITCLPLGECGVMTTYVAHTGTVDTFTGHWD